MPNNYSVSINDYDTQTGIMGFAFTELTAGNFTAVLAQLGAVRAALPPLIRGTIVSANVGIQNRLASGDTPSTDDQAQRGNKWRVVIRDTAQWANPPTNTVVNYGFGKTFDVEIPTANLTLRENNSDIIYTEAGGGVGAAAADIQTFVDAVEACWLSPYGGTGTVVKIEAVTRNGG